MESLDGYTLLCDPATRVICYARLSADGRQLVSTGAAVGTSDPVSLGLAPRLQPSSEAIREQVAAAQAAYTTASPQGDLRLAGPGELAERHFEPETFKASA